MPIPGLPPLQEATIHVKPYMREGKPVIGYDRIVSALMDLRNPGTSTSAVQLPNGAKITSHEVRGGSSRVLQVETPGRGGYSQYAGDVSQQTDKAIRGAGGSVDGGEVTFRPIDTSRPVGTGTHGAATSGPPGTALPHSPGRGIPGLPSGRGEGGTRTFKPAGEYRQGDIVSVSGFGLARVVGPGKKEGTVKVEAMTAAPGGKSRRRVSTQPAGALDPYSGPTKGTGSLAGLPGIPGLGKSPQQTELDRLAGRSKRDIAAAGRTVRGAGVPEAAALISGGKFREAEEKLERRAQQLQLEGKNHEALKVLKALERVRRLSRR